MFVQSFAEACFFLLVEELKPFDQYTLKLKDKPTKSEKKAAKDDSDTEMADAPSGRKKITKKRPASDLSQDSDEDTQPKKKSKSSSSSNNSNNNTNSTATVAATSSTTTSASALSTSSSSSSTSTQVAIAVPSTWMGVCSYGVCSLS